MPFLTEQILSNDYEDFILPYNTDQVLSIFADNGVQLLDARYMLIHQRSTSPLADRRPFYYSIIPKLYVPLSTVSLEESGIIKTQTQPGLSLTGKGVMIGFLDSGIDYGHPAFLDHNGRTRIYSIWDQTIQGDEPPSPYGYGTIYSQEEIQAAVTAVDDQTLLPTIDTTGHGTALAGIAAGRNDYASDFVGAAPESTLCVVKLKEAKQYLKDYYFADGTLPVYQENDLMMGINFLVNQAREADLSLVICIGLGTNQGDHAGNTPLSNMIQSLSYTTYTTFCVAGGNEGNAAHHYSDLPENPYNVAELLVPDNCPGFVAELWGNATDIYSVGIQTPLGTQIPNIDSRPGKLEDINLILERTRIQVGFEVNPENAADPMVQFRFQNPVPGIWIIRIRRSGQGSQPFHIWLPITGLSQKDVTFLSPDPDTTITTPGNTPAAITVSAYSAYNQSLYLSSSRGYSRTGAITPTLTAPGVDVTAPAVTASAVTEPSSTNGLSINRYRPFTGTSASAAITAGASALLLQWGTTLSPFPRPFNSQTIQSYLIRGATRDRTLSYPNRQWGYGVLNVYNIFSSLM